MHIREHLPSHLPYMAASMILILIPYDGNVLILWNMVGGEAHLLDVSLGEEAPHSFFTIFLHGSMRNCMVTMVDQLLLYGVSHMLVEVMN